MTGVPNLVSSPFQLINEKESWQVIKSIWSVTCGQMSVICYSRRRCGPPCLGRGGRREPPVWLWCPRVCHLDICSHCPAHHQWNMHKLPLTATWPKHRILKNIWTKIFPDFFACWWLQLYCDRREEHLGTGTGHNVWGMEMNEGQFAVSGLDKAVQRGWQVLSWSLTNWLSKL